MDWYLQTAVVMLFRIDLASSSAELFCGL